MDHRGGTPKGFLQHLLDPFSWGCQELNLESSAGGGGVSALPLNYDLSPGGNMNNPVDGSAF